LNRFLLGFKALFRAWTDRSFAERLEPLMALSGGDIPAQAEPAPEPAPSRSEALTLLAVLQREARLVDFVQEPIDGYSDEQVGAAVRAVHHGCKGVFDRLLSLEPLAPESEGSQMTVPASADPERFRLVGNVTGEPPYQGVLGHHGWQATRCEIPTWKGREASALVVAPAEVEVQ
jgi:hypothetical protein